MSRTVALSAALTVALASLWPQTAAAKLLVSEPGVSVVADAAPKDVALRTTDGGVFVALGAEHASLLRCTDAAGKGTDVGAHPKVELVQRWIGLTDDGSFALAGYRTVAGAMRLYRLRCDGIESQLDFDASAWPHDAILSTGDAEMHQPVRTLWQDEQGRLCVPDSGAIRCFDDTGALGREVKVDAVVAAIGIDLRVDAAVTGGASVWFDTWGYKEPVVSSWLGPAMRKPDGGIVTILRHSAGRLYPKEASTTAGVAANESDQLVEIRPDGSIIGRGAPITLAACQVAAVGIVGQKGPLSGVRQLIWLPEQQWIAAWPVVGWGIKANDARFGVTVLPADGQVYAYVELHDQLQALGLKPTPLVRAPLGWGGLHVPGGAKVVFDVAAQDLDKDGLDGAAEAAAKTSPWHRDSDGGGMSDGDEVLVAGTDPTAADDDPDRAGTWVASAGSALLNLRVGVAAGEDPWRVGVPPAFVDEPPLCIGGVCYDRAGIEVLRTGAANAQVQRVSLDRRYLLGSDPADAFVLLDLRDHTRFRPAGADAARAANPTADVSTLTVVGADEIYVASNDGRQIDLLAGGQLTPLLDVQALSCAEGLHCPTTNANGPYLSSRVLGYHDPLGALLVHVWTGDNGAVTRGWILALSADAPPRRFRLPDELFSFPGSRHDDLMFACDSTENPPAPLPPAIPGFGSEIALASQRLGRHWTALPGYVQMWPAFDVSQRVRVWDDAIVQQTYAIEGASRLVEAVRYEGGPQPGDVLTLESDDVNFFPEAPTTARLWRSGPRGGHVALWEKALPVYRVIMMDVAPAPKSPGASSGAGGVGPGITGLQLCAVETHDRLLRMRAGANANEGTPNQIVAHVTLPGVRACAFRPDGSLVLAADDPPRLLTMAGEGLTLTVEPLQALPAWPLSAAGTGAVRDLVIDAAGALHVRRDGDGRIGIGKSRKGGLIEVFVDQNLRIDGVDIGFDIVEVQTRAAGTNNAKNAVLDEYDVVQRPDGLLVLHGWRYLHPPPGAHLDLPDTRHQVAIVPRTHAVMPLQPFAGAAMASAVVPGGVATDPWTGAVLPEPPPAMAFDGGGGGGGGGTDKGDGAKGDGAKGDGGCNAGSAGRSPARSSWVLALLALLAILAWRRAGVPAIAR